MGGCCYVPRKTELLWWHWLLMASLIGLPMFFAVLYISRNPEITEEEKKRRGRFAMYIFWGSSVGLFFILTWFFLFSGLSIEGLGIFPAYVFWMAFLIFVDKVNRRQEKWYSKAGNIVFYMVAGVIITYILIPIFFEMVFSDAYSVERWLITVTGIEPLDVFLYFGIAMLPAHFMNNFSETPVRKTAWKALGAMVAGSLLFWAANNYSIIGNLYVYNIVRGKLPRESDINLYMDVRMRKAETWQNEDSRAY